MAYSDKEISELIFNKVNKILADNPDRRQSAMQAAPRDPYSSAYGDGRTTTITYTRAGNVTAFSCTLLHDTELPKRGKTPNHVCTVITSGEPDSAHSVNFAIEQDQEVLIDKVAAHIVRRIKAMDFTKFNQRHPPF